ncbi:MAG: hypothetical protein WBR15_06055 [Gammaproteobacteria bacterium]
MWLKYRNSTKGKTLTASFIGKGLTEIITPKSEEIEEVRNWNVLSPDSPMPFLALAALGEYGVVIGLGREVSLGHFDKNIADAIGSTIHSELIDKLVESGKTQAPHEDLLSQLSALCQQVDAAYSKDEDDYLKSGMGAGMAIYHAMGNNDDTPNPEDLFRYSSVIHIGTVAAVSLFDDLWNKNVRIVN